MSSKLAELEPADAWQPVDESQPWDLKWAAHLYRRAAFGVPPAAASGYDGLKQAVDRGRDACIESLLAGENDQEDFDRLMQLMRDRLSAPGRPITDLQAWWLYCMVHTPHPLRERCTLFWHDHFATSAAKVRSPALMAHQNAVLREHALGSFREMLREMGRDPAMLIWLDSNSNIKGRPNENYAREVFELFSLGEGHYTEEDIAQAARAFTGYATDGEQFVFRKDLHDDGEKTIFGKTGNYTGDDVVGLILERDRPAAFLAGKLFKEFVSENEEPSDELLAPLANRLRETDYNVASAMEMILRSRIFFSEQAYRQRIKSPVEYVVGMLRTIGGQAPMSALAPLMEGLGQMLFAPPTVKGWDGGVDWLNSATLLARHNLAWRIVGGEDPQWQRFDVAARVLEYSQKPGEQVDFVLELLLQDDVPADSRKKLHQWYVSTGKKQKVPKSKRIRQLVHTTLLMPEYQLA